MIAKKHTIRIGWNLSAAKRDEYARHQFGMAAALIEDTLADLSGGWTLIEGTGGWTGRNHYFREPMRQYDWVEAPLSAPDNHDQQIKDLIERVKELTGEEAVYWEMTSGVRIEFV